MATPTLTLTNHTSISTAESVTNWTQFDTLDPDLVKEGSNSITGTFRSDGTSGDYNHGSALTASGKHVRLWVTTTNIAYMDTAANGGYEFWMNDGTTTEYYTIFSSDDYYGGWFNMVIDCAKFTTLTLANVQQWGMRVQHTSNAKQVDNLWVDYLRYLDGYSFTGGSAVDKVTLLDVANEDRETAGTPNGYGILLEQDGVYFASGEIQIGSGATTTYFEMDNEMLVFVDAPVGDGLYALNGNGSGVNIDITGSTIKADGTQTATQYDFDMSTGSPGTVSITDNVFIRGGTFTFATGQTITGNTFTGCEQITHGGADMDNCTIKGYEGTANTSALIYNVAVNPSGTLDGASFTKGTAATHAIEFGTTSPLTMTLNDCDFSGYNASNAQNDSTFHFKRTTGTVTLTLSNCTGNVSYRTDGATIVIDNNVPVTFANLKDNSEVRVYNSATGAELAGIEDATAGSPDARTFTASIAASTVVDYVIHCFQPGDEIYQTIRVNSFTWPSATQTITINQIIDRNAEN